MTDHITKIREALEARDKASAALDAAIDEGSALKIDRAGNAYDKASAIFHAVANDAGVRSLLAALDEAKKDAKRWRHMRANGVILDGYDFISYGEIADHRVDAAIAAQEGGGNG